MVSYTFLCIVHWKENDIVCVVLRDINGMEVKFQVEELHWHKGFDGGAYT